MAYDIFGSLDQYCPYHLSRKKPFHRQAMAYDIFGSLDQHCPYPTTIGSLLPVGLTFDLNTKMKEINWKKVKITNEVMEYVIPKYGKTNWLLNDSYSQIILEDIYNTFYKDEAELAKDDKGNGKVDDKGKGKIDDKGKEKMDDLVDALEKGKSKLMVSGKGTKKASVDLVDVLEEGKIKKLSEDFKTFLKTKEAKEAEVVEVVEVPSDEEDSSNEAFFL
ncbi:hypothetical protein Tco_0660668 [Tanacetum coccineum]